MLYAPERQVDAWLNHPRLLGHFVLEGLLRVASHDEQAAVRQPLRKCDSTVFPLEPEKPLCAQTYRGDYRPHFWLSIRMQADAVISVSIKVAEHCVVASSWQGQIVIGCNRGGFFDADS